MMSVVKILVTLIVTTVVSLWTGTLFIPLEGKNIRLPFCWISGQILLWAGFQCICVPAILAKRTFSEMEGFFFFYAGTLVLLAGIAAAIRRRKSEKTPAAVQEKPSGQKSRAGVALWAVFALLLGVQLFLLCYLAYDEGDDAYYVAMATNGVSDQYMYFKDPYIGTGAGLDVRHALAPLPMWVSVISRFSGLSGAATAHVTLPLLLVPMTYCVYYLIGRKLLGGKKKDRDWEMPLFMCFTALLVLFGGYSLFSAENFLLVRGAQGKSVLANLIIPFLFYQMFVMLEKLEQGEKVKKMSWVLLGLTMIAGCLCSTLGCLLVCMLLGIFTVCAALAYHRWGVLLGTSLCVAAPVLFACLYVLL